MFRVVRNFFGTVATLVTEMFRVIHHSFCTIPTMAVCDEIKHDVFPLRLICIEDTLAGGGGICFGVPRDWDFHIISHTWTKDVREWSVAIANMLPKRKVEPAEIKDQLGEHVDTYAELFRRESFSGRRGYGELLEFLRILAADGVERVWFDALCINQGDAGEKDREIAHMGAYYARSAGCYVWCHGVGRGFRLWRQAPAPYYYKLPRWFSRVWTLQEFMLPSKVAFIVGMDKEGCTAYFAYKAYCLSAHLPWRPDELMDSQAKVKFERRINSFCGVNSRAFFPCPHCSAHQQLGGGKDAGRHVYLVERMQYLELMKCSSYISIANGRLPPSFWSEFKSPVYRMQTMLSCSDQQRRLQLAALAIHEISVRDCSEGHDEDRLLSILGLLQIEGKVQLRTGRSLAEQTLEVVQSLLQKNGNPAATHEHHRLVLFLCLAQYRGSPAISMSWAPTFTFQRVAGSMSLQSLSMFHNFTTMAQIQGLSQLGLKLRCPFLQAKVVPFAQHWQNCSTCCVCRQSGSSPTLWDLMQKNFILEVQNIIHYSVSLWLAFDKDHGDEVSFVTMSPATCTMAVKADTNIVERLATISFHVWLLLLAQDQLPGSSQPYGLFLVCVGLDKRNLHKVGVFFNGPGWDPETDQEDSAYATPEVQSGDSASEEDQDFQNEDMEELSDSESMTIKEDFKIKYDDGEEEEEKHEHELAEEEDEAEEEVPDWKEDLESMEWETFTVSGFGECVPLNDFSLDKLVPK